MSRIRLSLSTSPIAVPPRGQSCIRSGEVIHRCAPFSKRADGEHGREKFIKRPNVASEPGRNRGGGPLLSARPRHPGLPAKIAVRGEHGKGRRQVFEFLAEAPRQTIQPPQERPLRAVEPFNVASSYRAEFPAAYVPPALPAGPTISDGGRKPCVVLHRRGPTRPSQGFLLGFITPDAISCNCIKFRLHGVARRFPAITIT